MHVLMSTEKWMTQIDVSYYSKLTGFTCAWLIKSNIRTFLPLALFNLWSWRFPGHKINYNYGDVITAKKAG